jgi:hypothetical protein
MTKQVHPPLHLPLATNAPTTTPPISTPMTVDDTTHTSTNTSNASTSLQRLQSNIPKKVLNPKTFSSSWPEQITPDNNLSIPYFCFKIQVLDLPHALPHSRSKLFL